MKKILILTAGFGEGHNSAARGIRDGLTAVAPNEAVVELHDLFADTYGVANDWARTLYLGFIDRAPKAWGVVYRWLDQQTAFAGNFRVFFTLKNYLSRLLARFRPDIIVSVYPAYPHMLDEMLGPTGTADYQRVVVITDSLSVNAIWFRCSADYFLVPNDASAAVLQSAGVPPEKIQPLGFPVSPTFAAAADVVRPPPSDQAGRRVVYIINAAKPAAPRLVQLLAELEEIQLTVTVGRDLRLADSLKRLRDNLRRDFEIVLWSEDLPRLLRSSHLLISKAGGATVQEALAAACPMIVNHIIPGQEEGNARFIAEAGCGTIATSHDRVIEAVRHAFAHDAAQWREWAANVQRVSRPGAALDIARFLLSL